MKEILIKISSDFADTPGARDFDDGDFPGEKFLSEILRPKFQQAISEDAMLRIDLDDMWGYPSSFVSGSFGKLGTEYGADKVLKRIIFKSDDNPFLIEKITYIIRHPNTSAVAH